MKYSNIFEELNRLDEEEELFEMANIRKARTGLPYDIWVDSNGSNRKNKHSPNRIKIDVNGNLIPIEISDNPSIPKSVLRNMSRVNIPNFSEVKKYLIKYKNVFLAHCNSKIDDFDLMRILINSETAEEAEQELNNVLNKEKQL